MYRIRKAWKLTFSVLVSIIILAAVPGPTPAQALAGGFTVSQQYTFDLPFFVPCANGGAGEWVELTGTLHDLYHVTYISNGFYIVKYSDNPQGISGTGQTTGAKYQATGETSGQVSGKVGFEDSYSNNFRIIGQGTGNNFLVHENLHITVNANGTLTAAIDNFNVVCK